MAQVLTAVTRKPERLRYRTRVIQTFPHEPGGTSAAASSASTP